MSTSIITASYQNGITVDFTTEAWFNATLVAKQFKKRTENYLRTDSTKEYMVELHNELFPENPVTLKSVTEENQLVRIVQGGKPEEQGSWFHPELAVDFARWLSPRFAIWCDRQIKKILKGEPVQRDFVNEPLKIELSTVEQRKPLTNAVNYLIYCAKENGKELTQKNIYKTIHFRMGIDDIEELTVDRIQEARAIVGEIFQKVVIEGEYIAKGEPEPIRAEPEIVSEPFTNKEREQLQKIVVSVTNHFFCRGAWISAIHHRLRKATNNAAPNHYRIADKPIMAKEFQHIFAVSDRAKRMMIDFERDVVKRLVRGDEELDAVFAEHEAKFKTELLELGDDLKAVMNTFDRYAIEQFLA